ncbi:MAG: hypothetical protein K0Q49_2581 [Haloplasmataceae bacterium]|jgi:hypothetical protein|nr:hypothetical protein [Haloplasmataceae bacterium]
MKAKFLVLFVSFFLMFLTFYIPGLSNMWENSGVFEVWSFWLIILIFFFYIKRES